MERGSRQQTYIQASPAAIWELVGDPNRHPDCQEVSIFCDGTGVTTRFAITEAQGGTFVEGHFVIEPNSIGMTMVGAVAGRRVMRSWLERSLANLKQVAERAGAPT